MNIIKDLSKKEKRRARKIGTVRIEKVESTFKQLMMRLLVVVAFFYHIQCTCVCMYVGMYVYMSKVDLLTQELV